MVDVTELIRDAKLPETVVHVCLRSDLVHEYEHLRDIVADRRKRVGDSLSMPDLSDFPARMAELEEEMKAATVPFVLRGLPRIRFRALMAEHPPRKDPNTNDVLAADWNGVNQATYYDALIRETTVTPQLDDDTWKLLLEEKLSDRQYQELSDAAWQISREKVDFPFLPGDSKVTPLFARESKPPKS